MRNLFIFIFMTYLSSMTMVYGQETQSLFYLDTETKDQNLIFDQCIAMLMESSYFIQSTDKDAGLIQCKYVIKDKKWFSTKDGDILLYNILLRSDNEGTRIYLQASVQEKLSGGNTRVSVPYYKDDGVTEDPKIYDPLLDKLDQYLNK